MTVDAPLRRNLISDLDRCLNGFSLVGRCFHVDVDRDSNGLRYESVGEDAMGRQFGGFLLRWLDYKEERNIKGRRRSFKRRTTDTPQIER
jgi:hypothetical protein